MLWFAVHSAVCCNLISGLGLNCNEVTHLHFGSLEFEHSMVAGADRRCNGAEQQWSLDWRGGAGRGRMAMLRGSDSRG